MHTQQSKNLDLFCFVLAVNHRVNYNVVVDLDIDHIVHQGVHHVSLPLGKLLDLPPPPLANVMFLGLASCCHHKTWCDRRRREILHIKSAL